MAPKYAAETPGVKRRRVSAANEEAALLKSLSSSESRDFDFVCDSIRDRPELTAYIARLLRDGVLEKALATKTAKLPAELGRQLPARCKRIRNLAPRFIMEFFESLETRGPLQQPQEYDDNQLRSWKMSKEVINDVLQFALHAWIDCKLPEKHRGSNFEGPLIAVLKARYEAMGSRLANIDWTDIRDGKIGFFVWNEADPTKVTMLGGHVISLNIDAAFMRQARDWKIQRNCSIDQAILVSEELDASFELWPKVIKQYSAQECPIGDFAEEFEYPNAADDFPDPSGARGDGADQAVPAAQNPPAVAAPRVVNVRAGARPKPTAVAPPN